MTEETARQAVRAVFGDAVTVDVTTLAGGRMSLTVRGHRHTASLDGAEGSVWGWTVDPGEDEGVTGHANTAESLDEALRGVRDAIGGTA